MPMTMVRIKAPGGISNTNVGLSPGICTSLAQFFINPFPNMQVLARVF